MEFCGTLFSNNSRSNITGCYLVAAKPSICSNHLGASLWMENTTNTNQRKFQTFKICEEATTLSLELRDGSMLSIPQDH